jgi:hypothetical protein
MESKNLFDTMVNCVTSAGIDQEAAERAVESLCITLGGSYVPKRDLAVEGRNRRIIKAWRMGYPSREIAIGAGVSQRQVQRICRDVPKDLESQYLVGIRDIYNCSLSNGFVDTGDGKK